jgi:hypothetical protein
MDTRLDEGEDSAQGDRVRALCAALGPEVELLPRRHANIDSVRVEGRNAGRSGVAPDAVILDRAADRIVLVAQPERSGVATEEVARRGRSQFDWWRGTVVIVTAFGQRADLSRVAEMPAWGSCAWFEAEPNHSVWFGEDVGERAAFPA